MVNIAQTKRVLAFVCLLISNFMYGAMAPNTVVGVVNTGVNPAGIGISPNNNFAYVANNNSLGITGQNSVSVVDLTNNLPAQTITDPSFNQPFTVTPNAQGTIAYVTNSGGSTISMIDMATNSVVGTISGFDGPSGMVIAPSGNTAYVNNYGLNGNGNTIRQVDLTTNTVVGASITVGTAPSSIALSPNGQFLYTTNYVNGNPGTGTMSVIRTSDNSVAATVPGFSGPFAMAITPNGNYAYVANYGSNSTNAFGSTVSVVDLRSNVIVDTINVGIQPSGIAVTPDGRYVYVSNYNSLSTGSSSPSGQGTVNIIDAATNQVIAPTIPVGQSPSNITISPNGEYAYVSNYGSNTISAIALQSFQIVGKGCKMKDKKSKRVTNKLTWKVSGSSLPVSYSIYRDAALMDLAGTVPATSKLEFFDRNVNPKIEYTYYIVGVNEDQIASDPVAVPVTKKCKKK